MTEKYFSYMILFIIYVLTEVEKTALPLTTFIRYNHWEWKGNLQYEISDK